MKKTISLIGLSLLFCALCFPISASDRDDALFQYSTINALLNGFFDGDLSLGVLSTEGNFGIGTFNHLDGEMIALEGEFFQIKIDGIAYPVDPDLHTPFAVVTHLDVDRQAVLPKGLDYSGLKATLNRLIPNRNHYYAFRIKGRFQTISVRSVPAQTPPYRPLAEVVEEQAKFHYEDVEGFLIGFYTPDYMSGLNVPGYHFHFLNADRTRGGHVLALKTESGAIEIDEMSELVMRLPESAAFADLELTGARKEALDKVEKGGYR